MIWIKISIKVKGIIRICILMMRICNTVTSDPDQDP
jgi:hypothetical protein